MPSLKPLKSVAHNLAHQFASTLNYWHDDYAINHLFRAAESAGTDEVVLDALAGTIHPPQLGKGVIAQIVAALPEVFDQLLKNEGFASEQIRTATLRYNFNVPRPKFLHGMPAYECTATVSTVNGKTFEAHLTEKNT
jgi:hypothetical protein